ncbi:MAG: hypothetical protein A3H96_14005 [Acidobacteria bacterium RIFCSPLOWO2_02_FULL_67_36]|nr:MAG: hypothetical protein A3H96_14005 [Acidobacteria bacterium RIFCSPLOWO2_02_FULL_67_36]OFW18343.1 MAG: hypothetical protein A3G21_07515 [Acidobacteria bacterium RIFCSPLOWO2_12_FULL_66_21]
MIATRFHGRGGQGSVIASKLLASALFNEGWQVQAFPSFGAERTGAPVMAFLRCDHAPINEHYNVYEPDHVVVLDPVLLKTVNVTAGLKPGGWLLVNSPRTPEELGIEGNFNVATCDGTAIALAHGLGSRTSPIVNTAMAGAFAAVTALVSLDAILGAIPDYVPSNVAANQSAAREAFGKTLVRDRSGVRSGAPV